MVVVKTVLSVKKKKMNNFTPQNSQVSHSEIEIKALITGIELRLDRNGQDF